MSYIKICYFLGEFFKTQSDQNIHQNLPKCTIFSKFSREVSSNMPLNPIRIFQDTI